MSESGTDATLSDDQLSSSKPLDPSGERESSTEPKRSLEPEEFTAAPPEAVTGDAWGLSASDRYFALTLGTVLLLLSMAHAWRLSATGTETIEISRLEGRSYEFTLEVNSATWVEWMQLEGIGETLATRIVEDREANGPFSSIEDVQRVRGIGPKTLERIRPHLVCADCP